MVIPTLNEAPRIEALVGWAVEQGMECIVSDGGSTDETVALAEGAGAKVLQGARGRGAQLAAGAEVAQGEVLWFVHADTLPPADALERMERALDGRTTCYGAFVITTQGEGRRPWLAPWLGWADRRSRRTRWPYGDQAVFATRRAYTLAGGFRPQPLMEDIDLSQRLHRVAPYVRIDAPVRVSGRRFEARPVYYALLMAVFPWLYRFGVSPQWLARWYHPER